MDFKWPGLFNGPSNLLYFRLTFKARLPKSSHILCHIFKGYLWFGYSLFKLFLKFIGEKVYLIYL